MDSKKLVKESRRVSKWEDMDQNILLKIFMALNALDLIFNVSRVCRSWRSICSDPFLWKTLDLNMILDILSAQSLWPAVRLHDCLIRTLGRALALSQGNATSLICSFLLDLDVPYWVCIAERNPGLERIVIPAPKATTLRGFSEAVKNLPKLKSLTVYGTYISHDFIMETGKNCRNFSELKLVCIFDDEIAKSIVSFLPKLKVLSLRCSLIYMEALIIILDKLLDLEVLNISHCVLVGVSHELVSPISFTDLDSSFFCKTQRLWRFIFCQEQECHVCQEALRHGGVFERLNYEDNLWREDEVSSLAC